MKDKKFYLLMIGISLILVAGLFFILNSFDEKKSIFEIKNVQEKGISEFFQEENLDIPYDNYQIFNTTGANNFEVPSGVTELAILMIAGGGAGATSGSAGGAGGAGSGGLINETISVNPGETINLSIGSGGTTGNPSTAGGNTTLSYSGGTLTTIGGAPGARNTEGGTDGGSGSGAGGEGGTTTGGTGLQPTSADSGFGNDGGDASATRFGAGGGGAGSIGGDSSEGQDNGGDGLQIWNLTWAKGGAGAGDSFTGGYTCPSSNTGDGGSAGGVANACDGSDGVVIIAWNEDGIGINLISPEENSNTFGRDIDFVYNLTDNGAVGVQNTSAFIDGNLVYTNTSGLTGNYSFTEALTGAEHNFSVIAYDDNNVSYESSVRDFQTYYLQIDQILPENNSVINSDDVPFNFTFNLTFENTNSTAIRIRATNETGTTFLIHVFGMTYNNSGLYNISSWSQINNADPQRWNWTSWLNDHDLVYRSSPNGSWEFEIVSNTITVTDYFPTNNTIFTEAPQYFGGNVTAFGNESVQAVTLFIDSTNADNNFSGAEGIYNFSQNLANGNYTYGLRVAGLNGNYGDFFVHANFQVNVPTPAPNQTSTIPNMTIGYSETLQIDFNNYFENINDSLNGFVNVSFVDYAGTIKPPQSLLPRYQSDDTNQTKYYLSNWFNAINERVTYTINSYVYNRTIEITPTACNSGSCITGNTFNVVISSTPTEELNFLGKGSKWFKNIFPERDDLNGLQRYWIIFIILLIVDIGLFWGLSTTDIEAPTNTYIVMFVNIFIFAFFVAYDYVSIWVVVGILVIILAIKYVLNVK